VIYSTRCTKERLLSNMGGGENGGVVDGEAEVGPGTDDDHVIFITVEFESFKNVFYHLYQS